MSAENPELAKVMMKLEEKDEKINQLLEKQNAIIAENERIREESKVSELKVKLNAIPYEFTLPEGSDSIFLDKLHSVLSTLKAKEQKKEKNNSTPPTGGQDDLVFTPKGMIKRSEAIGLANGPMKPIKAEEGGQL